MFTFFAPLCVLCIASLIKYNIYLYIPDRCYSRGGYHIQHSLKQNKNKHMCLHNKQHTEIFLYIKIE